MVQRPGLLACGGTTMSMTTLAPMTLTAEVQLAPHESTATRLLGLVWYWARGFVEVILVCLAFPVAILLVGLPVALLVRAIIELANLL